MRWEECIRYDTKAMGRGGLVVVEWVCYFVLSGSKGVLSYGVLCYCIYSVMLCYSIVYQPVRAIREGL